MATLLTPSKSLYIDNCQCLHMNDTVIGDHPAGFDEYPQHFLFEVFDETRIDTEVPSNNNPLSINLTGIMKN